MTIYNTDIAIVGAGPAGVAAALAARRAGARVVLVEKWPRPGGMAVMAMVHSMLTFHGQKGHRIVGGIAQALIDRLEKAGGTKGHITDTVGVAHSVTPTDPYLLGLVMHTMLQEAGIDLKIESLFTEVSLQGDRIFAVRAPFFIDASGEGTLAMSSGCAFERGRDGVVMPATLIFNVRGIRMKKVLNYIEAHHDEFHHETLFHRLRSSPAIGVSGFFTLWKEAGLSIPRDRLLFYQALRPDEAGINSTRVIDFDPFDAEKLKNAHRRGLEQVFELYRFLRDSIPGFEEAEIASIAPALGIREGRRIMGEYLLSGQDVAEGRRFADEVALGGFPVDIHLPTSAGIETVNLGGSGFYGIPYRCLITKGASNLLVAGKCLSAGFEAQASARVQATSMAVGEAAGIAAALANSSGKSPVEIPASVIRSLIIQYGGILEPDSVEELP